MGCERKIALFRLLQSVVPRLARFSEPSRTDTVEVGKWPDVKTCQCNGLKCYSPYQTKVR